MTQDATLLTEEEIAQLSPQAQRILAARCAARVLPALGGGGVLHFRGEAGRHLAAVGAAVAAALLRGGGAQLEGGEWPTAARAAKAAANAADAYDAYAAAAAAAYAAADANAAYAARAVAYAADAADGAANTDEADAAKTDGLWLAAAEEPAGLLGRPLWPNGSPKGWAEVVSGFEKAVAWRGREDLFSLYLDLEQGRFDPEGWRALLDRWWKEYGESSAGPPGGRKVEPDPSAERPPAVEDEASAAESTAASVEPHDPGGDAAGMHDLGGQVATQAKDEAAREDHLGRKALVDALAALLAHPASGGKLTIGLLGHWGAGKSSVLKMLEEALDRREWKEGEVPYIVSTFNAWSYEHTGNIQAGLAQEVVNGLTGKLGAWERLDLAVRYASTTKRWGFWSTFALSLALLMGTIWRGVDGEVDAAGGVILLFLLFWRQGRELFSHPLAAKLQTYLRLPTFGEHLGELPVIQRQVRDLCKLRLENADDPRRLLFVVDDLDRCGVEGVVKTLEAVRLVMDLPNVTVIVAVDHRMALAALTHHYHELAEKGSARTAQAIARDYLGKIFQLPIQLSEPSSEGVAEYVNQVLFSGVRTDSTDGVVGTLGGDVDGEVPSANSAPGEPPVEAPKTGQPQTKNAKAGEEAQRAVEALTAAETVAKHQGNEVVLRPSAPLEDSDDERRTFLELARWFGFTNPRQLKRLHNCYRLLKALRFHRELEAPHEDQSALTMLFWLEYLYELEWDRRIAEEDQLFTPPSSDEDKGVLDGLTCGRLMERMNLGVDNDEARGRYDELKRRVSPFMLPYARLKEETESDAETNASAPEW